MHRAVLFACVLLATPLIAQERYWIANRGTNNIMEVDASGHVARAIDMGTSLRSAHVAPDGKIWVVRFIQSQIDIVKPSNPPSIKTVSFAMGSAFYIAFDNQGTAWVSGGSGVEQFDANGNSIQTVPLTPAAPLSIAIDTDNNKWIAHRINPGSLSRIDGVSGAVTTVALPGASTMQPVWVMADFRGIFIPSHIWVTGDSSSDLVEYDAQGNLLNTYVLPISAVGRPTFDLNGDIWVGSWSGGKLVQIDETTGSVLSNNTHSPNIHGLSVDSFNRLWATAMLTVALPGPPSECRRIDPANPSVVEHPGVLQVGLATSARTQSALSTPFEYSMVVAPFGDMDGDGVPNLIEIQAGSSPIDPLSVGAPTVVGRGRTQLGSTATLDVQMNAGAFYAMAMSAGLVAPGSGFTHAGWVGEVLLDPLQALPPTFIGIGSAAIPINIPNLAALVGVVGYTQGISIDATVRFTNITCFAVWQ